jgi:hypothetical protein
VLAKNALPDAAAAPGVGGGGVCGSAGAGGDAAGGGADGSSSSASKMSSAAAAGAGSLRPSACSGARAGAGAGEKAALPPAPPKRSRSVGVPGFFCEKGGGAFSRSPSSHGLIKVVACRVEDAGESCVDGGPTAARDGARERLARGPRSGCSAPRHAPLYLHCSSP